jgi:DNA mismatch endonuclease, patch repair protein
MADVFTPEKRSQVMSQIRGKDTGPEKAVRSGLHRLGFRFLLHDKRLPGKPDIVFPRYNAVLHVNGCFWHGHKNCHLFSWPKGDKKDWWREKINRTRKRDKATEAKLKSLGWRVGIIWECSLKGKSRLPEGKVFSDSARWLKSNSQELEIRGREK